MKSRAKKERVALDNRFIKFPDFLKAMGEKPGPNYTLDRYPVPGGPYTLDNVRWADKATQANNRRNTVRIQHNGVELSATEYARLTGQKADTVRRRKNRAGGWSGSRPRRSPRRPLELSPLSRQVAVPAAFKWVHESEEETLFWIGLFRHGEGDENGIWDLVKTVPLSNGEARNETFLEFMERMDRALIHSLTTGDIGGLPYVLADKLSSYDEVQRNLVLETSRDRLHRITLRQFDRDPLVSDRENMSCDISWMFKSPADTDFGSVIRQTMSKFEQAREKPPGLLLKLATQQARLPLGRKIFTIPE